MYIDGHNIKDKAMKLNSPLLTTGGQKDVAFVDPKSLTKEELKLITKVDAGNQAEVKLISKLTNTVQDSSFTAAEMAINADKGSYLRVITLNGDSVVESGDADDADDDADEDEEEHQVIVTETVNGHLTVFMTELNEKLQQKLEESEEEE